MILVILRQLTKALTMQSKPSKTPLLALSGSESHESIIELLLVLVLHPFQKAFVLRGLGLSENNHGLIYIVRALLSELHLRSLNLEKLLWHYCVLGLMVVVKFRNFRKIGSPLLLSLLIFFSDLRLQGNTNSISNSFCGNF